MCAVFSDKEAYFYLIFLTSIAVNHHQYGSIRRAVFIVLPVSAPDIPLDLFNEVMSDHGTSNHTHSEGVQEDEENDPLPLPVSVCRFSGWFHC